LVGLQNKQYLRCVCDANLQGSVGLHHLSFAPLLVLPFLALYRGEERVRISVIDGKERVARTVGYNTPP